MIIITTIFLSGCNKEITENGSLITSTQREDYKSYNNTNYNIISEIEYNKNLCKKVSYKKKASENNIGLKIILKDKVNGQILEGTGKLLLENTEEGSLYLSNKYSCIENIDSQKGLISVYSKGYTPITFELDLQRNKLTTIEISMIKSCSGGPSCFDNFRLSLKYINKNQTEKDEMILNFENEFYNKIQKQFELKKTEYKLSCIECNIERGGFIKAKGTLKDKSPLELYYSWGWCSSGGSDCGWETCFSSNSNTFFESTKTNICNRLFSKQYHDDYICTSDEAYDNTEEIRKQCLDGKYEENIENKKTLSIQQTSNRCKSSVEKSNFNCISN